MNENNLFKNRYRTESARLKNWDYATTGYYFITICTKDRMCVFGDIQDGKSILSEKGQIARSSLMETPQYFDNASLDEFIIMPNHVHLILVIDRNSIPCRDAITPHCRDAITPHCRDAINRVSTRDGITGGHVGGITGLNNPMISDDSVSKIIRWYKGRTSFFIRKIPDSDKFAWQSRFYDRIIRNELELDNIRQYIVNNPLQWEFDENNPNFEGAR